MQSSEYKTYSEKEGETMVEFNRLQEVIAAVSPEIERAEGGNKAAGVRARKSMNEIKKIAQEIRVKLLEKRQGPALTTESPEQTTHSIAQ
jgi:hypothetical protein